jgi:hypothetical protein
MRRRYDDVMRRILISCVSTALVIGLGAAPAGAQVDAGRCGARFPDSVFDTSTTAGPVDIYGSGVPEAILERYGRDFTVLVDWVQAEMGGLDGGVVVCIFEDRIPLDADALGWPGSLPLRAGAFGDEGIVVLSNWLIQHVPDAGYYGLLHIAQYRVSDGNYPEPFGNEVAGWYRNRLNRSVESVHNIFVRQNTGLAEPWSPFPWTVGRMVDPLLWNPEFDFGGAGDFANFAVANGGNEVLSNPLGAGLEQLDEQWRQALFDESGATPGGSKGWLTGLIFALAAIGLGVLMAWSGRRQKRIIEAKMRDLPWLEEQSRLARQREAVRTSIAVGGGGGDSRIGGRGANGSIDGDDTDGTPAGGAGRSWRDRVTRRSETDDDLFRHPGFDDER